MEQLQEQSTKESYFPIVVQVGSSVETVNRYDDCLNDP